VARNAAHLPIDDVLGEIGAALAQAGQVVVTAEPGAGKTTRIPLALVDAPWRDGGRIVVLEPRRVAARAAATFMARSLGEQVGATVGLTTREDRRVTRDTVVEVVTEGVLVRRLQRDGDLQGVACVLLDEFHERSLDADLALALSLEVRDVLRPDLRIGVLSATMDVEAVSALLGRAPIVASVGRAYPVEVSHRDVAPLSSARRFELARVVATAVREALAEHHGDVLVFLPGVGELHAVQRELAGVDADVLLLHGRLPAADQDRVLQAGNRRRVVLATDLAESSVTVPGVCVVVDAGLSREPQLDPRLGMTRLVTTTASRASADQRAGRAGRLAAGHAIRLWPRRTHGARRAWPTPEVQQAELSQFVLTALAWGTAPGDLRLLTRPPQPAVAAALALLVDLGAVDNDQRGGPGARITDHGRRLAALPLHPRLGHLLVEGARLGLADVAADVAALLGERDLVATSRDRPDADLGSRLAVLRGDWPPPQGSRRAVLQRVRADARRLRGLVGTGAAIPSDVAGIDSDLVAGALLALAWPDRVARRREGRRGAYLLANGRGALVDERDPLATQEWLAVADVDAGAVNARVHLAAAVDLATLRAVLSPRFSRVRRVEWDAETDDVVAADEERLGAVVVASAPVARTQVDAADALLAAVRAKGLEVLRWSEAARSLRARLGFLHRCLGDPWPDTSDAMLLDTMQDWLRPFLVGAITRVGHLQRVSVVDALRTTVSPANLRRLDVLAPTHVQVPSGSRVRLDYSADDGPVLAVKLQELFGMSVSPTVADGTVWVVVHLLSPAGRPLQVTRDLAGFWDGSYAQVRAQMRGRYPKHAWPENPREVAAHRGTKRNARPAKGT